MRKNWSSKVVRENAWGLKFTRWYLTAPSGNVYRIYRGCHFYDIYLTRDINNSDKSIIIGKYSYNNPRKCFQDALNKVYEMEENGQCDIALSNAIKNTREYKRLNASSKRKISYNSMP